ncbi:MULTISPECIES: hypothetical protein [Gammaproteobacteria]|uniref:hypothetical protein n=1 Tax=Gammaproteobacteria TaxID=1236 RepID=UPI000DCFC758|nr:MULTISPECIES: hypothetical protein [Gammaproteobacteria]RTE87496.1 hypothetical protein DQX04_03705 [Aliidiomarina sp. B3213]TCZ92719.1 hypothetical protein EYQ95_01600 [Lysobacter sp. N42]
MRQLIKLLPLVTIAAATTIALPAKAVSMSQPNYTHINATYLDSSRSESGIFFDAEYELNHKLFVFGRYQNSSYRVVGGGSRRESLYDAGVGKYFTIADGVTMDFSASIGRLADGGNLFGSGMDFYTLNTSFRNRFEVFETRLGYRYINFDNAPSDSGAVASGWWYFSPQFSLGVTFEEVYSGSSWGIGARFSF